MCIFLLNIHFEALVVAIMSQTINLSQVNEAQLFSLKTVEPVLFEIIELHRGQQYKLVLITQLQIVWQIQRRQDIFGD